MRLERRDKEVKFVSVVRGCKVRSDIELYDRSRLFNDVVESGNEVDSRLFEATDRILRVVKRDVRSII